MAYRVIWEPEALSQAERFAKNDPDGVRQVFASTDLLAGDPRPAGTTGTTGSHTVRRMHTGAYRIMYEIHDTQIRINIIHLGRL